MDACPAPATKITSHHWWTAGALLILTLAVYWPAVSGDFVNYDDDQYVTDNRIVQHGLTREGFSWAFKTIGYTGNWHPLTWLSLMLDAQVSGTGPRAFHRTNVILHAINAALLFLLLAAMTGERWRSAIVTAIFALHPLRVESVAWISERKDVLGACFGLLALIAYVAYTRRPGVVRYLLVVSLLALSLMAKPMLVTFPFLVLVLDFWPLRRWPRVQGTRATAPGCLILEKLPLLALVLASSVMTFIAQRRGGAIADVDHFTIGQRLANATVSYGRYMLDMVWPARLAIPYPLQAEVAAWAVCVSATLLLVISVAAFASWRRRPWLLVGWLWFWGLLVPIIGLVQVGHQAMADRYTYLPSIGLIMMVVWSLPGGHGAGRGSGAFAKTVAICTSAVIALVLVTLAALTQRQIGYWRDTESLFIHALRVTEGNWVADNMLGQVLAGKGQAEQARAAFEESTRIHPRNPTAQCNIALLLANAHHDREAEEHYRAALGIDPAFWPANYDLALLLDRQGRKDEAINYYRQSLRGRVDFDLPHSNMGVIYAQQGDLSHAETELRRAVALEPNTASNHMNLAPVLAQKGNLRGAHDELEEAIALDPTNINAWKNLGRVFTMMKRPEDAIASYKGALELDHKDADALRQIELLRQAPSSSQPR